MNGSTDPTVPSSFSFDDDVAAELVGLVPGAMTRNQNCAAILGRKHVAGMKRIPSGAECGPSSTIGWVTSALQSWPQPN
jgi:hypothetical protein